MNATEHYRAAEDLLNSYRAAMQELERLGAGNDDALVVQGILLQAQVHATLALVPRRYIPSPGAKRGAES